MLPPFIIDQIRKREERSREKHERPAVELPLVDLVDLPVEDERGSEDQSQRGVVIIDLLA